MHSKENNNHSLVLIIIIPLLIWLFTPVAFSLENINESVNHHGSYQQGTDNQYDLSIRYLLSDKNLIDRKIYLRGGYKGGDGIVNQFIENITMGLVEDIMDSNTLETTDYYMTGDSLPEEINQYRMFNGEIREINYIKRRMATGAFLNTTLDYFETTPLYKKLKLFEESISKYFFIEYSRGMSSDRGTLNLPGESTPHKNKNDNLYKISLSTLFYSSTDSFNGYYSLELRFSYLGTATSTLYDFGKNELKFRLKNENLNSCFSSNWVFTIIHNNEDATTFLLKMLFNY